MPDPFATLILTRPRAASERFLKNLGDRMIPGVRVVISPLLEIVPTGALPDLAEIRGVIFTSSNGVRFAGPGLDLPAYCVGSATCAAAADAGWDARLSGAMADDLVEDLIATKPPAPLLHVGGVHRRGDVARRLSDAGVPTTEVDVYDQRCLPLSQEAQAALAGALPVVVPLFSPRTARILASHPRPVAPLYLVAMSEAVMAETRQLPSVFRHVVREPDSATMVDTVGNLLRRVEAGHSPK